MLICHSTFHPVPVSTSSVYSITFVVLKLPHFNCSVVSCCPKRSVPPLFGINGFCFKPFRASNPAPALLSCLYSQCFGERFLFSGDDGGPAKFNKFCEWSHMRFRGGVKACITQASEEKYAPENIDADKSLHKSKIQSVERQKE